jgi:hypothetical protein
MDFFGGGFLAVVFWQWFFGGGFLMVDIFGGGLVWFLNGGKFGKLVAKVWELIFGDGLWWCNFRVVFGKLFFGGVDVV